MTSPVNSSALAHSTVIPTLAALTQLSAIQADFPGYHIWRELTGGQIRYAARRLRRGPGPHTVVTGDLAELRQALQPRAAGPEPGTRRGGQP